MSIIAPNDTDYRKYLDPHTLARISSLDLRARLIVEGLMTGMHRSPYQGISVEFAQHRQYVPGDDIRHVDWKVFGKTDKISPLAISKSIRVGMEGCAACVVRCKRVVEFDEPYEVTRELGAPEYETLGAFGNCCGIDLM